MDLYLYSATPDQSLVATTLADLNLLIAALADPLESANAATIARVSSKFAPLTQGDSGEPLTITAYDSPGVVAGWVTDAAVDLAAGLGLPDPGASWALTSTSAFTIVGNTRTGTLALDTVALRTALQSTVRLRGGRHSAEFTLQLRLTRAGGTETIARLPLEVAATVLT